MLILAVDTSGKLGSITLARREAGLTDALQHIGVVAAGDDGVPSVPPTRIALEVSGFAVPVAVDRAT